MQRKKKNASNFSKEDEEGEKRQRLEDEEGYLEKLLKEIATYWDEADDSEKEGIESNDMNENVSQFTFSQTFSIPVSQDIPKINTIEEARFLSSRWNRR